MPFAKRSKTFVVIGTLLGALTLWFALMFIAATIAQFRVPVNLPPLYISSGFTETHATVKGTWVTEGQRQAFPLQTTQIYCERELKRCTTATAQVMLGEQMYAHLDMFEILSWDKNLIVFLDNSPRCVSYTYTINFAGNSVTGIRKKKQKSVSTPDDCASLDQEIRLSLRGGFEISNSLRKEAMPWFGRFVFAPFEMF
jgi:hypothetical protein